MASTNNNKPIKQYKADIINDILELNPNIKGIKSKTKNELIAIRQDLIDTNVAGSNPNNNLKLNQQIIKLKKDRDMWYNNCMKEQQRVMQCQLRLRSESLSIANTEPKKDKKDKIQKQLLDIATILTDLVDNNDINDKAYVKLNDKILEVYNTINNINNKINRDL